MEQRPFGKTNLTVSAIGFGAWGIGGPAMAGTTPIGWGDVDDATSIAALTRAFERGITFFDTADFYGLGHSEELIGKVFGNRNDVRIASKVGHRLREDGSIVLDYSKDYILEACEKSLKRLRRDRIDYYQLHSAKVSHLAQGECIEALERLKHQGKIGFWGVSLNTFHPEPEANFLIDHHLGDGLQLVLNILNQRALPIIEKASAAGYGIIARMPLQFGLLTGKFTRATTFSANDHRAFRLPPSILDRALEALEEVWPAAEERGISKASFSLSFCASIAGVSTVIPGIKTPEQVERNTADILPLKKGELKKLDLLFKNKLSSVVEAMEKEG